MLLCFSTFQSVFVAIECFRLNCKYAMKFCLRSKYVISGLCSFSVTYTYIINDKMFNHVCEQRVLYPLC